MTRRRPCIAITLVLAFLLGSAAARADEDEAERKSRALALLKEGRSRYDLGRFEEAITLFEASYQVWPYPETLYNLAQAHRQLKHYDRAVFYYRSYLRNKPDAANRAEVEERIAELEGLIQAQEQSAEKPPEGTQVPGEQPGSEDSRDQNDATHPPVGSRPPGPVEKPWYADRWGWAIAGSSLIVAGVGIGFLVSAADLDDQATLETDQAKRRDLEDRADSRRTIGSVVSVIGGAGLVLGVVKLAWPSDSSPKRQTAEVVLGPNWVGLRGSF